MAESTSAVSALEYKDRRPGLIGFGILATVVGGLCALIALILLLTSTMMSSEIGLDWRTSAMGIAVYCIFALTLIWLGIGSMLCRRWARALMVILSWSWLLAGVLMLCFSLIFAGPLRGTGASELYSPAVLALALIFQAVFFVALPGAMVLFYGSRHVKATCEAKDPAPRWTDSCPLPVLTASIWLGLGALSLLVTPFMFGSVIPFFGMYLTKIPAILVILGGVILLICNAWLTYKQRMSGWWLMLVTFTLACASAAITFMRGDPYDIYRRLGYQEPMVEIMKGMSLISGTGMMWWALACYLLSLVYLFWIKKYFLPTAPSGNRGSQ